MSRFVIVAYRPKPGQAAALDAVLARHQRLLVAEGLVSDRPACVMRSADGTVIEVFEWRSTEAVDRAHAHPAVQALWSEFAAVCDHVPLAAVPEAQRPFAEFEPLAPGAAPAGGRDA